MRVAAPVGLLAARSAPAHARAVEGASGRRHGHGARGHAAAHRRRHRRHHRRLVRHTAHPARHPAGHTVQTAQTVHRAHPQAAHAGPAGRPTADRHHRLARHPAAHRRRHGRRRVVHARHPVRHRVHAGQVTAATGANVRQRRIAAIRTGAIVR